MKFRTEFISQKAQNGLDPHRRLLFLGSCFSQNIGSRLIQKGWDVSVNPCGVLYNPLSIASSIRLALSGKKPELRYNENTGRWFSWNFSTLFSHTSKEKAEQMMGDGLHTMREYILGSQAIIITLGTSFVYKHNQENRIVANCHKFPADDFCRYIVSIDEIRAQLEAVAEEMHKYNPTLRIIYTVSPVRHLSDGFQGNMNSKARLLVACESLLQDASVEYFPAFEILMDDLRDYRFYDTDMLHPSAAAADYILEKFIDRYVSDEDRKILSQGEKIYRRLMHRNMADDDVAAIEAFKKETASLVDKFLSANPGMRFPTL